ncbi:hypothetical protein ARMGADRAFT_1036626 [Armillaria gallica]|uniref:CCHC-type domain-containing protein n=1 Tax=Armillaria gallica TaxID=47427 RepID=A0A2H3CQ10_ARMGA|nr:hypothetical protein ARMGADRAFT_1036626 [Armillaria gallica]
MYKEHQKKWVFDQTHPLDQHSNKKLGNQKQITASSSYKTTWGTTSSSMNKLTGKGKGNGCCSICQEKGHISKNCPKKKKAEVHAVETAPEPLSKDTKIEEVKEMNKQAQSAGCFAFGQSPIDAAKSAAVPSAV